MEKATRKNLTFLIAICSLMVVFLTSITLAYFVEKQSGWGQNISSENIVFKLNGKSVNNTTSYDLNLLQKGDEADLVLGVSVSGSASFLVSEFTIDFDLLPEATTGTPSGTTADISLAQAIEVYQYVDGEYQYVSMLSEWSSFSGEVPVSNAINGFDIMHDFTFKLVYSEAAGDFYEDKTFNLLVTASNRMVTQTGDRIYVSNEQALRDTLLSAEYEGKTIVLNRDLTISESLIDPTRNTLYSPYKKGFDFNGYDLTLEEGVSIRFDYDSTTIGDQRLGIINSSPTDGGLFGAGKIHLDTPMDALLVQSDLPQTTLDRIVVENFSYNQLVDNVQQQLDTMSQKTYSVGDSFNFMVGYNYYMSLPASQTITAALDSVGADLLTLVDGKYQIRNDLVLPGTVMHSFTGTVAMGANSSQVDLNIKIRGTSAEAIADNLIAQVPNVVSSNLFLPNFDATTQGKATWLTDNEAYLDRNGVYLKNGLDSLTDWLTQTVTVVLIVDLEGEQQYREKTIKVEVLNAEERTERLYSYEQIILSELGAYTDIVGNYTDADLLPKANLVGVDITITDLLANQNSSGFDFIQITQQTAGFDEFLLILQPSDGADVTVPVDIKFTYDTGNGLIEHTVSQEIAVLALEAAAEATDLTGTLQNLFTDNAYIRGEGFEFYADAFTTGGAYVDFFVDSAFQEFVVVENGLWRVTADGSGRFFKLGEEYFFIDIRYDLINGNYIEAAEGQYLFANGLYYDFNQQVAQNNIYTHQSKVSILPALVPAQPQTIVEFSALVYEKVENGKPVYITDTDGSLIEYILYLTVEGIYHNNAQEIPDVNLYNLLVYVYDGVLGDAPNGYIEYDEAQATWLQAGSFRTGAFGSSSTNADGGFKTLNAENKGIASLKGLEYFVNTQAININNNSIEDLTPFAQLYDLIWVSANGNAITDLEPLRYLDNLKVFSLVGRTTENAVRNYVSDLEPISELVQMERIYFTYNDLITDFSPLQNYTKLTTLNIQQTTGTNTLTNETTYYMTLLKANNPGLTNLTVQSAFNPTNEQKAAALALSQMVMSDEVHSTLYVPTSYVYEGVTYKLQWLTPTSEWSYLKFNNVGNETLGYEINTPTTDRPIEISVTATNTTTGTSHSMANVFSLTLRAGQMAVDQLFVETSAGVFEDAAVVVPDLNLRSLLFNFLNTNTSDTVLSGNSTNKNTITLDEINNSPITSFDFSNKGIKNLAGLRYFAPAFVDTGLSLNGNLFENADISELAYLDGLLRLYLSGQQYDFSQLLFTFDSDNPANSTGLTTLTTLDVYPSYDRYSDEVLADLYMIYLSNTSVSINKDTDTEVWNPYSSILWKEAFAFTENIVVSRYNQTYYLVDPSTPYVTINMYGVKNIDFYLTQNGFYGPEAYALTHETVANAAAPDDTAMLGIKLDQIALYDSNVVARVYMKGLDGRGTPSHLFIINVKIEVDPFIYIVDHPEKANMQFEEAFPGRTLRYQVAVALTSVFNGTPATSVGTIGSGYFVDSDGNIFITLATIQSLVLPTEFSSVGMKSISESQFKGLQYTNITSLIVLGDFSAVDANAEYLQNLTTLTIYNSFVDLSTLTGDLPNLTKLVIGATDQINRGVILHSETNGTVEFALSKMPNLTYLQILNSNVYDWQGLNALIGSDLQTLIIHATNSAFTNTNSNILKTYTIVNEIYTQSTAANKNFQIGALDDATSLVLFDENWASGESFGETFEADNVLDYQDFATSIVNFGIQYNGVDYFEAPTEIVNKGQTIFLPSSTDDNYFLTEYGGYENDPLFQAAVRDFSITWRVYGLPSNQTLAQEEMDDIFGAGALTLISPATSGNLHSYTANFVGGVPVDKTLTVQATTDYYIIFEGFIGYGYFNHDGDYFTMTGVTIRSDVFPCVISGSITGEIVDAPNHWSFGNIVDRELRLLMYLGVVSEGAGFVVNGQIPKDQAARVAYFRSELITRTDTTVEIKLDSIAGSVGSGTVKTLQFNFDSANRIYKRIDSIYSLDGLHIFTGLREFHLMGFSVVDISGLAAMPQLERLQLRYNAIEDISAFAALPNLESVQLRYNFVDTATTTEEITTQDGTVIPVGTSVFATSRAKINFIELTENRALTSTLLTSMAAVPGGFPKLDRLTIHASKLWEELQLSDLVLIQQICAAKQTNGGANDMISFGEEWNRNTMSAVEVQDFIDMVSPSGQIYQEALIAVDRNTPLKSYSTTPDGRTVTYTVSRPSSNSYNSNNNLGTANTAEFTTYTTHLVKMKVSNGSILQCYFDDVIMTSVGQPNISMKIGENTYTPSDFDPELWARLTSSAVSSNGVVNYTTTSLSLANGEKIDSLRGLNYTNITTLTVATVRLQELWMGNFPSLTSITLSGAVMDEQALAHLALAPNLTTINLLRNVSWYIGSTTFDVLKPVTDPRDGSTSNLAEIFASMEHLTYLSIAVPQSFTYYMESKYVGGVREIVANDNSYANYTRGLMQAPEGDLFGYTMANPTCDLQIMSIPFNYTYFGSSSVYMDAYNYDRALIADTYYNNRARFDTLYNEADDPLQWQMNGLQPINNTLIEEILNFDGDGSSTKPLYPDKVYESDINTTGTTYFLPTAFWFHGTQHTITWEIDNNLNGVLTGNLLAFNTTTYIADQVTSFTIKGTVSEYVYYHHTFEVVKQEFVAEDTTPPIKVTPYYVETSVGVYEKYSDVFASNNLVQWLFNVNTLTANAVVSSTTLANFPTAFEEGSVLPNSIISQVATLVLPKYEITSIEGLQIFTKLSSLNLGENPIASIEPLRSLKLRVFVHNPVSSTYNYELRDFTPLYNSADTLEEFRYGGHESVIIGDLSFIMMFTKLKYVQVFASNGSFTSYDRYIYQSTYRYLVQWFRDYMPSVNFDFSGTATALAPVEFQKAVDYMTNINTAQTDVNFTGNYLFTVNQAVAVSNGFDTTIPAYMDNGGSITAIDWRTHSTGVSVVGYEVVSTGAMTFGATTLNNGDILTFEEFETLCQDATFRAALLSTTFEVVTVLNLDSRDKENTHNSQLVMKVDVDGARFERILGLDYSNIVPREIFY